jgi:PAS domain S-box-containing protein
MMLNCWEFMECGREPGGSNVDEKGVCLAATESRCNSVNNGTNGGRICWIVSGTLCGGTVQGIFAQKLHSCMECSFYQLVREEEGSEFQIGSEILPQICDSFEIARTYEQLLDAHKKLKEDESRLHLFQDLVDRSNDAFMVLSADAGRFVFANDETCRMLGFERDELLRIGVFDIDPQMRNPAFANWVFSALEGKEAVIFESKAIRKSGFEISVEVNAKRVALKEKNYIVCIGRDITERKRAEEVLHQSEEKYRGLFDDSIAAVYVFDEKKHFIDSNQAGLDLLGYSRDELLGMSIPDVDADPVVALPAHKQLLSGENIVNYEHQLRRKDGKIITVLNNSRPLTDAEGNVIGIQSTLIDITERKQAAEMLEESEQRYKTLVEMHPDAISLLDLEGNVLALNQRAAVMGGYDNSENIIGKNALEFILPENHEYFKSRLQRILETEFLEPTEYTFQKKDGSTLITESCASLVKDSNGNPEAILSIDRDITDRKRAEEEKKQLEAHFRQAQKMEAIGTLAGGIAHDFNNLLSVIMGNASVMLFGMDPSDENYETLEDIEQAAQSASTLTSELLGFARKEGYEVRPISLNNLIRHSFEAFARTKKEITMHQELAEDLSAIEADENQMNQVLLNIFINASDAMPGGGDFYLKTMNTTHENLRGIHPHPKPGKYVLLSITDSGEGMDQETQEHIFEPFFTTKGKNRGAGLGLASVYGIISSHGGYIKVDSEKGRGTTFSIYLPASEKEVQRPAEMQREVPMSSGTLLVVDDEKKVLDMAVKVLRKLGYTVLEATSGREAIEIHKANQDKIDLVILDIIMPKMGGAEVYDRMKEIDPKVKVLLSSGYSIDGEAKEILARGCDGFIQKPFNMRGLYLAIARVMGKA